MIIHTGSPTNATSGTLTGLVRVVSGILALVMVFIIVRRKLSEARLEKDHNPDENADEDDL